MRVLSVNVGLPRDVPWRGKPISTGIYKEPVPADARVDKPVGIAKFPREIAFLPRSLVEKSYRVTRWTELPKGGHFAAFEQPELFARELLAFVREL